MTEIEDWDVIPREHYLAKLRASKDAPFIKVLTGIRRCGKTTILRSFREELISCGVSQDDILALDFDKDSADLPKDHRELTDYVTSRIVPGRGKYLFFDEIQNVEDWEVSISSFFEAHADVYITGSNSQMLSSEIATRLSGREVEIHVQPLTFLEYTVFRKGIAEDVLFNEYIRYGGLPAVAMIMDTPARAIVPEVIAGVYNTVYVKDVENRHELRGSARLQNLLRYVMRNIGDRTSPRNASDYLKSKRIDISHVTVEDYLGYLAEAFLIYRSERIDSKTKEYLATSDKFYASDLGIRSHIVPFRPEDMDGILENLVYCELRCRCREVAVCAVGDREIDFVTDPKSSPAYYQVCMSLANPETLERELRPLREIGDNYPKTVVTFDRYVADQIDGIRIVSIRDWLMGRRQGGESLSGCGLSGRGVQHTLHNPPFELFCKVYFTEFQDHSSPHPP